MEKLENMYVILTAEDGMSKQKHRFPTLSADNLQYYRLWQGHG
jgi:hypothetical protein